MDLEPAGKSAWGTAECSGRDTPRPADRALVSADEEVLEKLQRRLGRLHARQRIGIEDDREARVFGQGLNFFHPENWRRSPAVIRTALQLTGLYWRAGKNAENVQIRRHDVRLSRLPSSFDGFTLLHISDLHVDISGRARKADHLSTEHRVCQQRLGGAIMIEDYPAASQAPMRRRGDESRARGQIGMGDRRV